MAMLNPVAASNMLQSKNTTEKDDFARNFTTLEELNYGRNLNIYQKYILDLTEH